MRQRRRVIASSGSALRDHAHLFGKPATDKQRILLQRLGKWKVGMSRYDANKIIAKELNNE